jgi:hypothetical protein
MMVVFTSSGSAVGARTGRIGGGESGAASEESFCSFSGEKLPGLGLGSSWTGRNLVVDRVGLANVSGIW